MNQTQSFFPKTTELDSPPSLMPKRKASIIHQYFLRQYFQREGRSENLNWKTGGVERGQKLLAVPSRAERGQPWGPRILGEISCGHTVH